MNQKKVKSLVIDKWNVCFIWNIKNGQKWRFSEQILEYVKCATNLFFCKKCVKLFNMQIYLFVPSILYSFIIIDNVHLLLAQRLLLLIFFLFFQMI